MNRFRYALAPALDAARMAERSAARVFVALRRAADDADAQVAGLTARAHAVLVYAAADGRALLAPRSSLAFVDRERCVAALALRRTRAVAMALRAAGARDAARAEFDARVQRRRACEAHRERALDAYRRACELAEAAAFDESNACGYEARSYLAGMHRA